MQSSLYQPISCSLLLMVASHCLAQTATDRPIPTFLDLQKSRVTKQLCEQTFLVVGKLRSVEYTGDREDPIVTTYTNVEVNLRLDVEQTLFGPPPPEAQIAIQAVWYAPIQFRQQGTPGNPTRGDHIFYEAKRSGTPKEGSPWKGGRIGLATEAEVTRLKRISEILALDDPAAAATLVVNGCGDADGQFAGWCLNLLEDSERLAMSERCFIHDVISKQVPQGTFVEECRLVLQNSQSPCIAYAYADHILAKEIPTNAMEQFRHECHLRRLSAVLANPPQGADYYAISPELQYLLIFAYPKFSPERKIEVIDQLREFVSPYGPENLRWIVFTFTSRLLDPRSDELRSEVFRFYRDFVPPVEGAGFSFCTGLTRCMETDSQYSKVASEEGLKILSTLLLGDDAQLAQNAGRQIGRYGAFCRREKIGWPDLKNKIRELRDATPHLEPRNYLTGRLQRWDAEDPSTE